MTTSKTFAIYYNSSSSRACGFAAIYEQKFTERYGPDRVELIASTAERMKDIQFLHDWQQRHQSADHLEIVVIGGDGSVNIAAQCAVAHGVEISVVPSGTGNDFAAALGIRDWRWRLQTNGGVQHRAVGKIDSHYFINHAGCGISVALQDLQGRVSKKLLGRYSYLFALLRYVFRRPSRRCKIAYTHTNGVVSYDEFQVAAVNRAIGGGIVVYPEAGLERQTLGFLRVPQRPRWRQLNALYWLLRQRPQRSSMIEFSEGTTGTIGDEMNVVEMDGDSVHLRGPVNVEIIVGGLAVRRPMDTNK